MRALLAGCAVVLLAATSSASTGRKGHHSAKSKTSEQASSHASTHSGGGKSAKRKTGRSRRSSKNSANWRRRGQRGMDAGRIRQIQAALVREHYLTGEPTGVWDQQSKDAMARYQANNGWQTKSIPDARALIRLGLGPDHADLINPDTAMTSGSGGVAEKPQPGVYQPR